MAEVTIFYDGPVVTLAEAKATGLTRYFSGRSCKYGHIAQRIVSNATCERCLDRKTKARVQRRKLARLEARLCDPDITIHYDGLIISLVDARRNGLIHYFTGKPCKRGHVARRYTTSSKCAACAAVAAIRDRNVHQDRHYNGIKRWNANNPDRVRETNHASYLRNLAEIKLRNRQWRLAHPEENRIYQARRRARKIAADGDFTPAQVERLFEKQRGKCANCRKKLGPNFERDHIMPLIRGGSNDISNIQLLCKTCNRRKQAKDPFDFARENGRLL